MSVDAAYARALERLARLARFGMRPGLDTVGRLLARLGHPERGAPALHVAGTNGKGSTAAFAEAMLRSSGARVGLYTSPHLLRFTERIRVDGAEIAPGRCAEAIERAFAAAEGERLEPTFFEIATAAAFSVFAEERVDVAVIECGLGGRLDATNACLPFVSVVTSIGLDHTDVLGDTLEKIAFEKVGIARSGVPLVVGPVADAPRRVIAQRASEAGAPLLQLGRDFTARHRHDAARPALDYRGPGGRLDDAVLGLAGAHQAQNAALALTAVAFAPRPPDAAARRSGLAQVAWPGRLERLAPGLLVDGAHNADGAVALAAALAGARNVTLIAGVLADKDAAALLGALLPIATRLVCTRPASPRALPAADLHAIARRLAPSLPIATEDSPPDALARAREGGGLVVAFGSLYLVGELRALVTGEPADPTAVSDPVSPRAILEGAPARG